VAAQEWVVTQWAAWAVDTLLNSEKVRKTSLENFKEGIDHPQSKLKEDNQDKLTTHN